MDSPVEVRLLTAGSNFLRIGSMIALGLNGYDPLLPEGSTASVHTYHPGRAGMMGMAEVADGKYDMGMTSPLWMANAAANGVTAFGLTDRPLNIRALGALAHDDQLALAVRADLGITSLRQVFEEKIPLKISTGPLHLDHTLGWALDALFAEYGATVDSFEEWGGFVSFGERQLNFLEGGLGTRGEMLAAGRIDAVFDEGLMSKAWLDLTTDVPMTFLPIEDDVLSALEEKYGAQRTMLRAGRLPGIEQDTPTLDFKNWLMFCRGDLDDEIAYKILQALEAQIPQIHSLFEPTRPYIGLSEPIDMAKIGRDTVLPLHPGAEKYYVEHGYL